MKFSINADNWTMIQVSFVSRNHLDPGMFRRILYEQTGAEVCRLRSRVLFSVLLLK